MLDLMEKFGDKYQVVYEQSYYAEHGENATVRDPQYMLLQARSGAIRAEGDNLVFEASAKGFKRLLKKIPPEFVVEARSDKHEIVFKVEHFKKLKRYLHPKTKRVLKPEHKALLVEKVKESWARRKAGITAPTVVPEAHVVEAPETPKPEKPAMPVVNEIQIFQP